MPSSYNCFADGKRAKAINKYNKAVEQRYSARSAEKASHDAVQAANAQRQAAESALLAAQRSEASLQSQLAARQTTVQEFSAKLSQLEPQLSQAEQLSQDLSAQVALATTDHASLADEKADLLTVNAQQAAELQESKSAQLTSEAEVQRLAAEIHSAKQANEAASAINSKLQADLDNASASLQSSQSLAADQINSREAAVAQLQSDLATAVIGSQQADDALAEALVKFEQERGQWVSAQADLQQQVAHLTTAAQTSMQNSMSQALAKQQQLQADLGHAQQENSQAALSFQRQLDVFQVKVAQLAQANHALSNEKQQLAIQLSEAQQAANDHQQNLQMHLNKVNELQREQGDEAESKRSLEKQVAALQEAAQVAQDVAAAEKQQLSTDLKQQLEANLKEQLESTIRQDMQQKHDEELQRLQEQLSAVEADEHEQLQRQKDSVTHAFSRCLYLHIHTFPLYLNCSLCTGVQSDNVQQRQQIAISSS